MNCDFVRVEANSEAWRRLRFGRLTASHAGDWLAGENTQRYQDYMQLIVHQLLGYEEEEHDAPWFSHGKAMEPWARDAYQWKFDVEVDNNLFLIHPEYDWLGASPDGVFTPGMDGMIEIKCRNNLERYNHILVDQQRLQKIEACYRPQVQCQMLVSGLDEIEFVNYFHDSEMRVRKLHVFNVERDQAMIDRIEEKAIDFMLKAYRTAGEKLPRSLREVA